jgi:enoyl-CoA hydratase/carnithine racemase
MGELVRYAMADDVATLTLDSPANRNALSRQLLTELHAELDRAERQRGLRAVVLTHAGPTFCAGADLKERAVGPPDSTPFVHILERLSDSPVPTIAAVDGAVRAGGIGLMAACDLVVVRPDVTFAFTEVRIAVAPAIISVPILRRVRPTDLAAPFLTGDVFDAAHALTIGLVNAVDDDVAATVARWCAGIAAGAPRAVAETKRLLRDVPTLERSVAYRRMRELSDELFQGTDALEAMRAFREKRLPGWGRERM